MYKLKPLLLQHPPANLTSVPLEIKEARAIINEPTGGCETPLKCLGGLVLGIRMDAQLFNIPDPAMLRICIRSADQVRENKTSRAGQLTTGPGHLYVDP